MRERKFSRKNNITGNFVTNESVIRGELCWMRRPLTEIGSKIYFKNKIKRLFKEVDYKISDGSKNNLKIIDINVESNQLEKNQRCRLRWNNCF